MFPIWIAGLILLAILVIGWIAVRVIGARRLIDGGAYDTGAPPPIDVCRKGLTDFRGGCFTADEIKVIAERALAAPFSRSLANIPATLPYRHHNKRTRTAIKKYVSRSLDRGAPVRGYMLCAVEFIHSRPEKHVYILDASTLQIPILSEIFPDRRFEIVSGVGDGVVDSGADRTASILIIDTIKTGGETDAELMEENMRCIEAMKPAAFCTKLISFAPKYQYLSGDLRPIPWDGPNTTICALVGERNGTSFNAQWYDARVVEAQMYYHNTVIRPWKTELTVSPHDSSKGHCYDCWAESHILGSVKHATAAAKAKFAELWPIGRRADTSSANEHEHSAKKGGRRVTFSNTPDVLNASQV